MIGLVVAVYAALFLYPLLRVFEDSFREFIAGRIGSDANAPFTLANYRDLLHGSYLSYFWDTFRMLLAFPIAYFVARRRSDWLRRTTVGLLITPMFLSVLDAVMGPPPTKGDDGGCPPIDDEVGSRLESAPSI
ncbi:ABC-type spermidine/putrescine transport system permease subunit I [Bradyrhizobium sp. USDA 4518]